MGYLKNGLNQQSEPPHIYIYMNPFQEILDPPMKMYQLVKSGKTAYVFGTIERSGTKTTITWSKLDVHIFAEKALISFA